MIDTSVPHESPIESQTVSHKVYQWIKNAIVNGEFQPGERIIQENLTKYLQVSRTPVRDALQRLSTEGLVVLTPFHGAEVFALSKKSLDEIYEVRILLENFAAQRACDNVIEAEIQEMERLNGEIGESLTQIQKCMELDRQFHIQICRAGQSEYVLEVLTSAWNKSDPYKSIYYNLPGNVERTLVEHAEIIAGLRNRDKAGVARAIRHHLQDVVDTISNDVVFE